MDKTERKDKKKNKERKCRHCFASTPCLMYKREPQSYANDKDTTVKNQLR